MKRITAAWIVGLVALVAPSIAAQTPEVVGRWDVSFHTQQGTLPATMNIARQDGKLSAVVTSQQGELPATVTMKESAITLEGIVQTQNGPITIVMSGKVAGDTMAGTVDFGGQGGAHWEAKRPAPAQPSGKDGQGSSSQEKPAETMTGTWAFEVHHSAGVSTPTVTITQTGDKLSGKYVSSYGQFELTGSTKGSEFRFTVVVGTEQTVQLVYTGTRDGDTVKGGVTMGEMGEGTFTGKRK